MTILIFFSCRSKELLKENLVDKMHAIILIYGQHLSLVLCMQNVLKHFANKLILTQHLNWFSSEKNVHFDIDITLSRKRVWMFYLLFRYVRCAIYIYLFSFKSKNNTFGNSFLDFKFFGLKKFSFFNYMYKTWENILRMRIVFNLFYYLYNSWKSVFWMSPVWFKAVTRRKCPYC